MSASGDPQPMPIDAPRVLECRFAPNPVLTRRRKKELLFDDLVGAREADRGHFEAERLCGLMLMTSSNVIGCMTDGQSISRLSEFPSRARGSSSKVAHHPHAGIITQHPR